MLFMYSNKQAPNLVKNQKKNSTIFEYVVVGTENATHRISNIFVAFEVKFNNYLMILTESYFSKCFREDFQKKITIVLQQFSQGNFLSDEK